MLGSHMASMWSTHPSQLPSLVNWLLSHDLSPIQGRFGCREWTAKWTAYDFSKIGYHVLAAQVIRKNLLDR